MSEDLSEFHEVFFEEADELVESMEAELLDMLTDPDDPERINTVFRAAHSIKGGSATFGFSAVAELTHVMETLMDEVRDGLRRAESDLVDLLLKATDCLKSMLDAAKEDAPHDEDAVAAVKTELEAMLAAKSEPESEAEGESEPQVANEAAVQTEVHQPTEDLSSTQSYKISFKAAPGSLKTANDPLSILSELDKLGDLEVEPNLDDLPVLADMDPEVLYLGWKIRLTTNSSQQEIESLFEWLDEASEVILERVTWPTSNQETSDKTNAQEAESEDVKTSEAATAQTNQTVEAAKPLKPKAPQIEKEETKKPPKNTATSSIRVGIDKIDKLINLVGELVITQSMLTEEGSKLPGEIAEQMQEGLSQLQRYTRELQENVMQIRMVPISNAFNRLPRMIHDLTSKLGKKVELKMFGEQTELDKTVLESIGDPLVHLVRNAVDHGIELPEQRVAEGKPEQGSLELHAYHESGNIIIEIIDDGAGIDTQRVLSKAKEKGLVGKDEQLEDKEVFDLLFHPGFSTANEVSDVSGRGVGMDVVRRNIQSLGGNVEVESKLSKGSVFRISLPLTLAIIDGQLVRVGAQTFVMPLTSIVESIQLDRENISVVAGKGTLYRLRNEYLPLVQLANLFKLSKASNQEGMIVVVECDGGKIGLLVDDLQAQQQVVIKSLEANYRSVNGISGATILGDGTVALILDIDGINKLAKTVAHSITQAA
ncbi:MAG: chemotaxis protein CheA [Pseudomonadota bacterium]